MPSRKHKPCHSKKAAKSNFPQIRSLDPNQAGRDVVKDIMEGGRERWCFSPPRTYPSSIFSSPQIRNRDPDQRIPEEIMAKGQGSKDSSPPGGHRSSTPTQQQIRKLDPDQHGRDIPEEIMAEGRGSKDSSPPGGHRSSRPTQQQYRDRQPYVRRPQQYQDHRTYEPRPGPEGRHPHYPEQYPSSRGAERTIRNRDPDQRGRDIPEEIMAKGQGSKDSSPPGGHRSSTPTQQQIRNLDPDQRGRDIPEEIMAEGRGSKDSSPPGGHRSSRPTQQQYRDRQPYVRRPQQNQDHRTYEPRPGPEGRQPHYPEQYPSSRTAQRWVHDRYPDQRGRDDPEEIMAEGRGSKDSSPPGGHRSSNLSPQQYHYRQPYVRPTQQYYEPRSYEPRPGPEGRQPHYPERPVYSGANRMIHDRYPDQRGRDDPEEIMAEGRGSRHASPPGGHRSSPPTQPQYRDRQPYVRRPQQYQDHRTYEPRPGPEGRHPHYPEQYPSSRGAERTIHDRYPDQRGRDIPEEIMAEGRGSKDSSPPGGHRSSRPTQQQYRDRQPYVRRPQQYQDHRTYEHRPGPEGRHPHYPEQYPSSRTAERWVHDRYPDQCGRDDPEEIMAEGRESRYSSPPGRHRSSNLSPQQYHHRQPYVRPTQQYYEHRSYKPRPGPEGRQPHYPERPVYSGANRMIHDRYPDQCGRDDPEEIMAEGRESRYSSPPGGHRSSPPTQPQHSKRPGKPTPKAVDPTTQPILMNRKEASDTKPGPVDVPKLKQAAQRSPSPGLVKKSGNAWNPAMRRQSVPAEKESHITQDLFRKVRSILNKLTPQKYIKLRNQLLDLTINTEERLKGVVDLLYERAINEPRFLVTYAKMCGCLATLIVPTAENSFAKVNFHKLLLRRCQKEFQKEKVDDVAFETKPKMLYSAALTARDRLQVEPEEAKDITQKRFIGNIKLLCELFKHKMLNDFIVHDCLDKLLRNNNEVALECLCILLTTISKGHNCDETKMVRYLNYMQGIVTEGKTSSRIRSMLEETIDTIDLTLPNLVSRKAEQGPKPVQEVHKKEAHEEQKEPVDGPKLHQVGRRSSSPGLVTPSLAPPNPPTKDEPLLEEPSTALSVAAPEALNSLAETRTELETAGHDMRPQDPTPPQCPNSEAPLTLKSPSSSGKRGRKGRKRHNKPPNAGSPR